MVRYTFITALFLIFLTFDSAVCNLDCSVKSKYGIKEWVDNQPLETVTWEPNKVCHTYETCYGKPLTSNSTIPQQIIPVFTQPNGLLVFQSSSQTVKYYKTDKDGFGHCKFSEADMVADSSNVKIQLGSNYFIANDTAHPWLKCSAGLRLNVTVLSSNCSPPPSLPTSSSSSSSICGGRGKCLAGPYQDSYQCSCCDKYDGDYCEKVDGCFSDTSVCLNGGYCKDGADISDSVSSYICQCSEGFRGKNCELEDEGSCRRNECMNGGECVEDDTAENGFICQCADGFTGLACQDEKDECSSSPCKNAGKCVDGVNKYTCECQKDFSGVACEVDERPCRPGVCKNGGHCEEEEEEDEDGAKAVCLCPIGFSGRDCSTEGNSCLPNPCQHSTECIVYSNNSYTCICDFGYEGQNCDTAVTISTLRCASNPCKSNGKCEVSKDGYQCRCDDGSVKQDCGDGKDPSNKTAIIKTQPNSNPPSSPSTPPYAFIVIGIVIIIVILIFIILLILFLNKRKSPPSYQPYTVSGEMQLKDINNQNTPSSPAELFQDDAYPDETISYSTSTLSSNVSTVRARDSATPVVKRNVKKNVVA